MSESIMAQSTNLNEGAHYFDFYRDESDYYQEDSYYGTVDISYPENARHISPREMDDAEATIEKYGLTPKQRDYVQKRRMERVKEDQPKVDPLNPSPYALLRLPVSVYSKNHQIPAGFYLLEYKDNGEDKFVIFRQGNTEVLHVPVTSSEKQHNKVKENYAVISSITDGELSIELNTKNSKVLMNVSTTANQI